MEDFYGDGSLNQFSSDRTRVQQTAGGIGKNNRRVRLLNFERAMKAQFGPNVVVSPDGTASRNGKVVGQIDTFLKDLADSFGLSEGTLLLTFKKSSSNSFFFVVIS